MTDTVDPAWHAIEGFTLTFVTLYMAVAFVAFLIELWWDREYTIGRDDWGNAVPRRRIH